MMQVMAQSGTWLTRAASRAERFPFGKPRGRHALSELCLWYRSHPFKNVQAQVTKDADMTAVASLLEAPPSDA